MRYGGRFFGELSLCAHLTLAMILGCAMTDSAFAQTVLPSPVMRRHACRRVAGMA